MFMAELHKNRPLSPHLGIYRWQFTNTLSILHRITGFGLTLGLIPLALWLWGAAYSPWLFTCITELAGSIVGMVFLFGWSAAFYYHLANGLRHLNWDLGRGFKLDEAFASAQVVISFAASMTVLTWAIVLNKLGMI
jgi:succinate dehydrogenase / fumarate reductase, cytochrome b subunit